MADSDKEQLDEELASAQKILETYRRNRRHLAEGQAKLGGKLDLELKNNIDWHDEQIQVYEAEIVRLKAEVAVAAYPLAEAQYRASLGQAWSNPTGRPTVADRSLLEVNRLQLGILPERARELEAEIRADLAEELMMTLNPAVLRGLLGVDLCNFSYWDPLMKTLGRSIRLDARMASTYFLDALATPETDYSLGFRGLRECLLSANPIWPQSGDFRCYESFLSSIGSRTTLSPCSQREQVVLKPPI